MVYTITVCKARLEGGGVHQGGSIHPRVNGPHPQAVGHDFLATAII